MSASTKFSHGLTSALSNERKVRNVFNIGVVTAILLVTLLFTLVAGGRLTPLNRRNIR